MVVFHNFHVLSLLNLNEIPLLDALVGLVRVLVPQAVQLLRDDREVLLRSTDHFIGMLGTLLRSVKLEKFVLLLAGLLVLLFVSLSETTQLRILLFGRFSFPLHGLQILTQLGGQGNFGV